VLSDPDFRRFPSAAIKSEARRLGFEACGISRAEYLDDAARRLETWLNQGRHASMSWMERNFDKRVDPRRLVEGARSVISVLCSYYAPVRSESLPADARISRYAWGEDYHHVLKDKLKALFEFIQSHVPEARGRAFVDSAPVMDKVWAARAGLGWIGKHSNLIHRRLGSYFFLGELILDLELEPDGPVPDHCGTCTRCIDACPTDAIYQPYVVDANLCISYLTIEHREDDIPDPLAERMEGWIFGCDICQEVCPWNKFSRPTSEVRFQPRAEPISRELTFWEEIDLGAFREIFRKNPVKRAKFEGFKRNVRIARQRKDRGDNRSTVDPGSDA
jgi:epoxyqueuosine reductase